MIDKNNASKLYELGEMRGCINSAIDALQRVEYISKQRGMELTSETATFYEQAIKNLRKLSLELSEKAERIFNDD